MYKEEGRAAPGEAMAAETAQGREQPAGTAPEERIPARAAAGNRAGRLVRSLVFGAGALALLYLAGYLCRPWRTDTCVANIEAFYDLEDNSADVLIFGSSKPLVGISPMELYTGYGITSYNDSNLWQRINTTQLFVRDALTHQSPKVVVIEADNVNEYLRNIDLDGEIYYTRAIHWSSDKLKYLRFCFSRDLERYLTYLFPLYMFHENWEDIPAVIRRTANSSYTYEETFGYLELSGSQAQDIPDNSQTEQKQLRARAVEILEDIVSTCQDAGAQVIFYISPSANGFKYEDAMKTFCREHDCAYISGYDEWDEIGLDEETDYVDIRHLNASGAKKLTDYLGQYLVDHYDLEDHRGEDNPWQRQMEAG